jgi:hypothetical protein
MAGLPIPIGDYLPLDQRTFDLLIEQGDILSCPVCGEFSAHSWNDSNMDEDGNRYDNCTGEPADIWHIGAASGFEWECGNPACRAHLVERDSPILAECYTHRRPE